MTDRKCVFQDHQGAIDAFEGVTFLCVRAWFDKGYEYNITNLWLQPNDGDGWYMIFGDWYDYFVFHYDEQDAEVKELEAEHARLKPYYKKHEYPEVRDLTELFVNKTVASVKVEYLGREEVATVLMLLFTDGSQINLEYTKNDVMTLVNISSENNLQEQY